MAGNAAAQRSTVDVHFPTNCIDQSQMDCSVYPQLHPQQGVHLAAQSYDSYHVCIYIVCVYHT